MKPLAVARRYARALADVAQEREPKDLQKIAGEVQLIAEVIGSEPVIARFFDDPSVRPPDKAAAAATLARKARIGPLVRRFLEMLIENRRLAALPTIAQVLGEIRDERTGVVPAEATLAVRPSPAVLKKLRESLERMTGRTVRLTVKVDPAVLGGARTRVGTLVYDGTLKRQLLMLRKRLAEAR